MIDMHQHLADRTPAAYALPTCHRALTALAARDHATARLQRNARGSRRMRHHARASHLSKLAAHTECRARDLLAEAR